MFNLSVKWPIQKLLLGLISFLSPPISSPLFFPLLSFRVVKQLSNPGRESHQFPGWGFMAVTWPHFEPDIVFWCQQFWFFILLRPVCPVTDSNCWQPMTAVFLNKLTFEKLPPTSWKCPPKIVIRSVRSPVYSTVFSRHETWNMTSGVELGDGQPGRSMHSCISYLQTSDLSPPWSPCANLSSHPTAACHAFTLNPSSSQSWPETVSATGQTLTGWCQTAEVN